MAAVASSVSAHRRSSAASALTCSPVVTSATSRGALLTALPLTRTFAVISSPSPSAEALARRPLITRLKPFRLAVSGAKIDAVSRDFGPLDSVAVVRKFTVRELVVRYRLVRVRFVGHQVDSATLVGEWDGFELDDSIVANRVGDAGVQLDSDFQFLGNVRCKTKPVGFRPSCIATRFPPPPRSCPRRANRVRTAWEGETRLRLRHAAARRGCREQGQHDEAASPDWLLNLLHGQLSRRLAVSACHGTASGNGRPVRH